MPIFRRAAPPDHLLEGDRAMAACKWADAARHYAILLRAQPGNRAIWVQQGHALKELGELDRAAGSYQRAIAIDPRDLDARTHLAHLRRRQGLLNEAIDEFAAIIEIDPLNDDACRMLVEAGARHRVPQTTQRAATAADADGLREKLAELRHRIDQLTMLSTYPLNNYDGFRRDIAVAAPPQADSALPSIVVDVDARGTAPYFLRATLLSLLGQSDGAWQAVVCCDEATAAQPVASLAFDPRIRFGGDTPACDYVLHVSAGTILDAQALGWFKFALARTGAAAAWCDSDHAVDHWRNGMRFDDPQLWGVFDLDMMAQAVVGPPAVAVRPSTRSIDEARHADAWRTLLIRAAASGPAVHIPRLLASVLRAPEQAADAPQAGDLAPPQGAQPLPGPVAGTSLILRAQPHGPCISVSDRPTSKERIQIVMPTRDGAAMVEKACSTLLGLAASPERIDLTIVDNRSRDDETIALLARLAERPDTTVVPFDEPFNWSRANHVGMAAASAEIVLFANNDVEMLTDRWDDLLRGYLARPDIGAVGCRLLYPDASLQHCGILFGLADGKPIHDGPRVPEAVTGPQDRYVLTHCASAVTGAFLAARRDVIGQVGGFDEIGLMIAHNDIDFCLRIRAADLKVLYAPAISLIHHESKTRGLNDVAVKVAWDLGELGSLHARWGESLVVDPGYNPHWSTDRQYDGYRDPPLDHILAHIDLSAMTNPWLIQPAAPDRSEFRK